MLIFIILLTSFSIAIIYTTYTSGLYEAPDMPEKPLAITGGWVFNGTGTAPFAATVVVEAGEITCVEPDCEVPADARRIDASGMAILPGLIELQAQFYAPSPESRELSRIKQLLEFTQQRPEVRRNLHRAGITGLRSVGDAPENILALRQQVREGDLAGPSVFAMGALFTAPGGYPVSSYYVGNQFLIEGGTRQVRTATEARAAATTLLDLGVDGLKAIFFDRQGRDPRLAPEVLRALGDLAQAQGRWYSVHTGSNEEVRAAAQAGANLIEYGTGEPLDSLTLAILQENPPLYLPMLNRLQENAEALAVAQENIRLLYQAGIPVGAGGDPEGDRYFGRSLQRELELLVEAGLPDSVVLREATGTAARYLKLDDQRGSVAPGLRADLLIVPGKPWEDIRALRKVTWLLQEGRVVVQDGKVEED